MTTQRRNSLSSSLSLTLSTKPDSLSSSFTTTSTNTSSSSSSSDFDTDQTKKSYTSLKDLLPTNIITVQSPTACIPSCGDIPIRNHLVKQAAWAYLQPNSVSPGSGADNFLRRVFFRIGKSPIFRLLCGAARAVRDAFSFCFLIAAVSAGRDISTKAISTKRVVDI